MSAEIDAASPGAPASRMRRPSAVAMSVNAFTPSRADVPIVDVALHPGPEDRPVAPVRREELLEERAQLRVALGVGTDRPEPVGERVHLLRALGGERAEQVFLVGEVQIEGAVRRARGAHDVVDTRRVEAALGEHAHARVEQSPHRLAALRAQLARLRGRTRHDVARALPAATIAVAARCVRFAHGVRASRDAACHDRRSGSPVRRSYCVRHRGRLERHLRRHRPRLRRSRGRAVAHAASARATSSRWCCRPGPSTSSRTARRRSSARSPRA